VSEKGSGSEISDSGTILPVIVNRKRIISNVTFCRMPSHNSGDLRRVTSFVY
jgi:hypothetical protein